jgi:hypothetical protein
MPEEKPLTTQGDTARVYDGPKLRWLKRLNSFEVAGGEGCMVLSRVLQIQRTDLNTGEQWWEDIPEEDEE